MVGLDGFGDKWMSVGMIHTDTTIFKYQMNN